MNDILDDLRDLYLQATTERSHYYVAGVVERAIAEIERLRGLRGPYFTKVQWFDLPLALRKRWWEETGYGSAVPSPELLATIKAALKHT